MAVLGPINDEEEASYRNEVSQLAAPPPAAKTLQPIMNAASKIIGAPLPSLMDFYLTRRAARTPSAPRTPSPASCPQGEVAESPGPDHQTPEQAAELYPLPPPFCPPVAGL